MATPTEELAKPFCSEWYENWNGSFYKFDSKEKLQAFREAVEAESDAERMKQPAIGMVSPLECNWEGRCPVIWTNYAPIPGDKLYAQPFPSTDQLQQAAIGYASPSQLARLLGDESVYVDMTLSSDPGAGVPLFKVALQDSTESRVCDQCDGDGWNYNAIEGQVPCVCMTEAEPYQQLQQRVKELTDALRDAREFVDRPSEPWYTSGQDLLKAIDEALDSA